jgi:alpha-L-arabinofuranosidase
MLKVCGRYVNYVDIRTGKDSVIEKVETIVKKYNKGKRINIASTEWIGLDVDKPAIKYVGRVSFATMGYALGVAMGLNAFERHAEYLKIGNFNGLTNQWYNSSIETNANSLFFSPAGCVLKMYANHRGEIPLTAETESDGLDISASQDRKGEILCLRAVNTSNKEISGEICADDFNLNGKAEFYCVKGDSLYDINDFEFPNRISIISKKIHLEKDFIYDFPPFSTVTLLMGYS